MDMMVSAVTQGYQSNLNEQTCSKYIYIAVQIITHELANIHVGLMSSVKSIYMMS